MQAIQPTSTREQTAVYHPKTLTRCLRVALPFFSALGYGIAGSLLFFRAVHGKESGISDKAVRYTLLGAFSPSAIAVVSSGAEAAQQFCANGYEEAKKVVAQALKPGGLIRKVILPLEEIIALGKAAAEMDMAYALASDPAS